MGPAIELRAPGFEPPFLRARTVQPEEGTRRPYMEVHQINDAVDPDEQERSVKAEISREMVRIYKEQFGRGPTKARTAFAGPDLVMCTLEHSLTPVEEKLVQLGEHQRLRDIRLFFQHATEAQFREVIERLLGREVRAFVSGMDVEADVSDEIFHLVPVEPGGARWAKPTGDADFST
jgi:uncharacterized protein YbcI